MNRTDVALDLATQTEAPSWGHFATTVPGTFWENWQQTSGSFNHVMLAGGIDPWIFSHVCGVRVGGGRGARGFGRGLGASEPFHLDLGVEAVVARRVGAASCTVGVPGGEVALAWAYSRENGTLTYDIVVPFGHTAQLMLPAGSTLRSSSRSTERRAAGWEMDSGGGGGGGTAAPLRVQLRRPGRHELAAQIPNGGASGQQRPRQPLSGATSSGHPVAALSVQ